jgi:hypothetical protein
MAAKRGPPSRVDSIRRREAVNTQGMLLGCARAHKELPRWTWGQLGLPASPGWQHRAVKACACDGGILDELLGPAGQKCWQTSLRRAFCCDIPARLGPLQ